MAQFIYTMNRVGKVVPPKRIILRDISLSFFPGAKIGVLGLNGSGKSTLLKIMAGVDKEIEGEARAAGRHQGGLPAAGAACSTRPRRCAQVVGEGVGDVQGLIDRFNAISDRFAEPMSDEEMNKLMEEQAKMQDKIDAVGGWELERKLEIAADALRLPPWDARDRQALRRREAPRRAVPAAAVEARHAAARRADQPSRRGVGRLARAFSRGVSEHRHRGHARPLFSRQRRRMDPRARPRPRHSLAGQLLLLARAEGAAPRAGRAPAGRARARRSSASSSGCAPIRRRARPSPRRACSATRSWLRRSSRSATKPTRSTFLPATASAIW